MKKHTEDFKQEAVRIDHDIALLLGGWTTGSSRTAVHENYGSGYRVDALNEAVRDYGDVA